MPKLSPRALSMLSSLLLILCAARGSAQDDPAAPDPLTPARRALIGPRTAIGLGAILLTAAPVIGIVAAVQVQLDGANVLGCDDWISGKPDPQCEADQAAHDATAAEQMPWVIAGSVTLGLGGAALLAYGIVRVAKVRRAQRYEALLKGAQLAVAPGGAHLSMRLRF
jgi:hypothetical protein